MISSLHLSLTASGDRFSPTQAEARLGIVFAEKTEPGALGTRGRHAGRPAPGGYARIDFDVGNDETSLVSPDSQLFRDPTLIRVLEDCGASDLTLYICFEYTDQCNFELSSKSMAALAGLGVTVAFSCWAADPDRLSGNS